MRIEIITIFVLVVLYHHVDFLGVSSYSDKPPSGFDDLLGILLKILLRINLSHEALSFTP